MATAAAVGNGIGAGIATSGSTTAITRPATAKLTDVASAQELQVRKNKDDYYAKSSAVAGVYKVLSSVGTSMNKIAAATTQKFRWEKGNGIG